MYYVYILQSQKNNKYYTGYTHDLEKRIKQHNAGKIKSTKSLAPYVIIHKEVFETLSEARKRELYIKRRKSRKYIEKLIIRGVA